MNVTGGQSSITVTLTLVTVGEQITLCGTGVPTACVGGPNPPGGGTGTFNSVSPAGCGLVLSGVQQNVVSFTSTCAGTITLSWQCLTTGPITFFLQSTGGGAAQGNQTCNLATSGGSGVNASGNIGTICVSGNCLSLTANPNVVSCKGGSTTVTAFTNYQFPQVIPSTPQPLAPGGLPMAQQPYFFFTVTRGTALIQQTSNNTAVVTLLEGMPESDITATTNGISNSIRVIPYCRPGSPGSTTAASVSGTPGAAPAVAAPAAATPAPVGSLTITASPGTIETCDGSVFLSATIKDANGKLMPDGTNVLFIATRGILDPASANTVLGTANVVYTSDLKTAGSVRLSAQAGSAFASVDVPVLCGVSGSLTSAASGGNFGTPTAGSPTFRPPSTGQGTAPSITIRPPSTGDAGLRISSDDEASR